MPPRIDLFLRPRDLVALRHLRDRRTNRVHRHEQFQASIVAPSARRRSNPSNLNHA